MDQFVSLSHGAVNYTGKSKLVQFRVLNVSQGGTNDSSTSIKINILLQRMYFYHLAATYLPTSCLLLIAIITLYIDDSHFEATIMVSLTSMLVMYTLYQSIAVTLPQTAYLKMVDIWLLFGLMMPFVIFLLEVFFELLKVKFNDNDDVKSLKQGFDFSSNPKLSNSQKLMMIKKTTQICVPAVTVGFMVIYWCYALLHYNTLI